MGYGASLPDTVAVLVYITMPHIVTLDGRQEHCRELLRFTDPASKTLGQIMHGHKMFQMAVGFLIYGNHMGTAHKQSLSRL